MNPRGSNTVEQDPQRRAGGYVPVPNHIVNDERLSYKAVGLLAYMLSRPPGWEFSRDRLARGTESEALTAGRRKRPGREGREAVGAALRELTAAGYYRTRQLQGEGGRWRTETEVTATPGRWPSNGGRQ